MDSFLRRDAGTSWSPTPGDAGSRFLRLNAVPGSYATRGAIRQANVYPARQRPMPRVEAGLLAGP